MSNIINNSKDSLVKQILQEQRAQNHSNTFYEKVSTIGEELNIKLEKAVIVKKSDWKRTKIKFRIKIKKEQKRQWKIKPN